MLDEAEKRAALAHSTSLLTSWPENDRLRQRRKRGIGLFDLVLVAGIAGVALYVIDPTLFPPELQNIDWRALEDRAVTTVEDLLEQAGWR
jgi:hypothetical protein